MDYDTLTELEWDQVEKVWDLLEQGEVERARVEVDALLAHRADHPDLLIVEAAVALDEGEPERALRALHGAERSADPALFFHLRAFANYESVRLEEARDDALKALAIQPDQAETHDLLSRVLAHLGDAEGSAEHAEAANALDPDGFPLPLEFSEEEFDAVVEHSLLELPERVRQELEELPVLVESLPSREVLTAERAALSPDILGLFVGRHLMERSLDDVATTPGAIYLFRTNLLRVCTDREQLEREIRITVQHEVGHLLGLDEDELERWGLA